MSFPKQSAFHTAGKPQKPKKAETEKAAALFNVDFEELDRLYDEIGFVIPRLEDPEIQRMLEDCRHMIYNYLR